MWLGPVSATIERSAGLLWTLYGAPGASGFGLLCAVSAAAVGLCVSAAAAVCRFDLVRLIAAALSRASPDDGASRCPPPPQGTPGGSHWLADQPPPPC